MSIGFISTAKIINETSYGKALLQYLDHEMQATRSGWLQYEEKYIYNVDNFLSSQSTIQEALKQVAAERNFDMIVCYEKLIVDISPSRAQEEPVFASYLICTEFLIYFDAQKDVSHALSEKMAELAGWP